MENYPFYPFLSGALRSKRAFKDMSEISVKTYVVTPYLNGSNAVLNLQF